METTSVTVVIPVYNVAPIVERCLISVMRQSYPVRECIIVDDGSTDDSISKCQRLINDYEGETRFVIIRHEYNRGLSAARNTGTNAATSTWVYYLDSDDEISPDCFEKLIAPFNITLSSEDSIEMILGEYRTDFSAMSGIRYRLFNKQSHYIQKTALRLCGNEAVRKWYFSRTSKPDQGWNKLLRLSFIKNNHLFFKEGLLYEDLLWSFYLYGHLNYVVLVPEVTYIHHRRPGSIMTQTACEEYLKHHGIIFKEIAEQIATNERIEEALRWIPDFCHCYIDAADNSDYKYAYQVFKNQLSDGNHQLSVWKLKMVNTLSMNPIGRVSYNGAVRIKRQILRIKSIL